MTDVELCYYGLWLGSAPETMEMQCELSIEHCAGEAKHRASGPGWMLEWDLVAVPPVPWWPRKPWRRKPDPVRREAKAILKALATTGARDTFYVGSA